MTLEFESVDADGVLTRVPLSFAYAERWAKILDYPLFGMSDVMVRYRNAKSPRAKGHYYTPAIEAYATYLKLSTAVSTFTMCFQQDPLEGGVTCDVGMWGEPMPEDGLQDLMLAVRDLPYSSVAIEKLIEKSDWLDANPMYRGLPGVAGKHMSVDQLEAGGATSKPADWDW